MYIRKNIKYLLGFIIGIIVAGTFSVYAISSLIDSKVVSYDNNKSKNNIENVQDSIDDLYQKYKDFSKEQDSKYTESILNGTDPVLGKGMIPVTIDDEGIVKYANINTPWYSYEEKDGLMR